MSDESRVPIERINTQTHAVTGRGTALVRGATFDDYRTDSGAELKLRPGEMFAVVVRYTEPIDST